MTRTCTIRKILTDVCIVVTISLVIGAGLETAARLLSPAREADPDAPAITAEKAIGRNQPWGAQHLADAADAREVYVPYVEFRSMQYASATLNVDSQGRRRVPGSCQRDGALTMMAFGGSTMFGAGVPDKYTIPAYLQIGFNREGRCVRVINYGSSWWQSSQSLIQLVEVLTHGGRPDLMVFYDGINDVNAVAFGSAPGGIAPDGAEAFAAVFAPASEPGRFPVAWGHFARHSLIVRTLADRFAPSRHKDLANEFSVREADMPALAAALVDVYATNVRTVNGLAREYGFAALFFLQPVPMIAGKHNTAPEEAAFRVRANARGWERALFRQAYSAAAAHLYLRSLPNFHDISRVFDGMTDELYLDSEHLLPAGNQVVAEQMARALERDGRLLAPRR